MELPHAMPEHVSGEEGRPSVLVRPVHDIPSELVARICVGSPELPANHIDPFHAIWATGLVNGCTGEFVQDNPSGL